MRPLFRGAGIRARIVAAATIALAFAVLVGALFVRTQLRAVLYSSADEEVLSHARDIADLVSTGDFDRVLPVEGKEPGWVQIVDEQARVVSSTANIVKIVEPLVILKGLADGTVRHLDGLAVDSGNRVTVAVVGADSGGHHYRVIAAGGLAVFDAVDKRILRALSIAFPAMLAVAALTQWLVASRALRPVEAIRKEVAAISTTDLSRRVPEPIADDEIRRLAVTMNSMLGRLQTSLDRQRRFIADASHELRSPLASLRTQVEVAARTADANLAPALEGMLAEHDRLNSLVADLLLLARQDSDSDLIGEPVDFGYLVRQSIKSRTSVLGLKREVIADNVLVHGNEAALVRVVRNLVDNAERHAISLVSIRVFAEADDAVLEVQDDGPGVPLDEREAVFQRFHRLDDARAADAGGSGLGLAIVRELLGQMGGTVEVAPSQSGARFVVRLPLLRT